MDDLPEHDQYDYDLDTCDLEPIHTPGRIQPFGALLAGPMDLTQIDFCSANTVDAFGQEPAALLGTTFIDLLGSEVVHDLRNLLSLPTARSQRERLGEYGVAGGRFEIYAHRNPSDQAIVEFEPVIETSVKPDRIGPIEQMRKFLATASQKEDLGDLLKVSVRGLYALTGYDRVMAYRYAENGDGEVVAEARASGADSFLGLRYPAWDVPTQARALQVKNPLRMLSDVHQSPIPILAREEGAPPLDIALAHLRGISPIHVEYLANMGVGASMTVGLVVDGRLWGMFSCHHGEPKIISSDMRIAVELYGQMISLIIKQKMDLQTTFARRRAAEARERIFAETNAETDLLYSFQKLGPILSDVIECDGLAVVREGKVLTHGFVPSTEAIRAIAGIREDEEDLIVGTENLGQSGWAGESDITDIGGALVVRATAAYPLQLIFFREEVVRHVKWAGRPEKELEVGPHGPRISPRGSFAAYLEAQEGFAENWRPFDYAAARELQILLTQITAKGDRVRLMRHQDLVSHQRQQDLMIAELNHRVKNILALIRSLSRQARSSSASLESYALALEQRIAALAAAHDLAISNSMQGVSLKGILELELAPYLGDDKGQVLMTGPRIGLRADVAPMIALVIHEIVSNAVKYGALSSSDGIVRTRWELTSNGSLKFRWREMGGPPVKEPERHGFGRALIEKAIPYELDGTARLEFAETGLVFDFDLPEETLVELGEEKPVKILGTISKIEKVATGKSALLVEDNVVLAMDMVDSLSRLGTEAVETVGSFEEAIKKAEHSEFDFAVLDLNLRGRVSFDVAKTLLARRIPFLFVTGYGSSMDMPTQFRSIPILTKPVDEATLSVEIERLLHPSD